MGGDEHAGALRPDLIEDVCAEEYDDRIWEALCSNNPKVLDRYLEGHPDDDAFDPFLDN